MFIQQLINGITLGGIYALISLGYTMVYGVLALINFAHSEIFMLGAFAGLGIHSLLYRFIPQHTFLLMSAMIVTSVLASGLIGVLTERFAYRPLRKSDRLAPLISAIGISLVLQNAVMLFVSSQALTFPEIFPAKLYLIFNVPISSFQIFIIAVSILLMLALHYFVQKTKLGIAIRAVSLDRETAALMGINISSIIMLVFLIGGGLGGAAGVLVGVSYGSIKYNMGFLYGMKAFTAAVLGGIGNIPGAMVGGFILGTVEGLGAGYLSSTYKDVFAFLLLIVVLIIKPTGLFGNRAQDKC